MHLGQASPEAGLSHPWDEQTPFWDAMVALLRRAAACAVLRLPRAMCAVYSIPSTNYNFQFLANNETTYSCSNIETIVDIASLSY